MPDQTAPLPSDVRTCRCGHTGPLAEFQKRRRNGTIRELTTCPACRYYHRDWQQDPVVMDRKKQTRDTKGTYLWAKYGLTEAQYRQMHLDQDHRCAICKLRPPPGPKRALCVDHDHDTGKVRGLLCFGCNSGLGMFKDDAARMADGIKYLALHGKP